MDVWYLNLPFFHFLGIDEFIHKEKVNPFVSRKDEYLLFKKILKQHMLSSNEMEGINERSLLKAREESILLLKENTKKQKEKN